MRPIIPLFLTCATVCFAVPSSKTIWTATELFANRVRNPVDDKVSLSVSGRQSGLNLSPCTTTAACVGDRRCGRVSDGEPLPCPSGDDCVCLPLDASDLRCSSDSDCDAGESCTKIEDITQRLCVANDVLREQGITPRNVDGQPPDSGPTHGFTGDLCKVLDDCRGLRGCWARESGYSCSDEEDCRCLPAPFPPCVDNSECPRRESCVVLGEVIDLPFLSDSIKEGRTCVSLSVIASSLCIGAHFLVHISREELVFEKDAIAYVLCDFNDSCATPGHVVQYKGRAMMMKSYCEIHGCTRKVMKVNSPKYRRGLTVPSKTKDLVFTALAARFESRVEEGVLSAAVRLGF